MDIDRPSKLVEVWFEESVGITEDISVTLAKNENTYQWKTTFLRLTAYFDIINEWGVIIATYHQNVATSYRDGIPQQFRVSLEIVDDKDYRQTVNRAQEIWNSSQDELLAEAKRLLTEHKVKYA